MDKERALTQDTPTVVLVRSMTPFQLADSAKAPCTPCQPSEPRPRRNTPSGAPGS